MKECSIIIGSLFGDEGKGHMTDICANKPSTINVRFNGGAQASHTVVTPDNKRHAFRHFGAGTFTGATTYLSEDFIVNVFAFSQERRELYEKFTIKPIVYVNPKCIVTTLSDIYINQMVEKMRGSRRHGSCGLGINETVERSKIEEYLITIFDLLNQAKLQSKIEKIQTQYVPMRLKAEYGLDIEDLPAEYRQKLISRENIDMFLFYAQEFVLNVQIMGDDIIERYDNAVFEGAQGLLLDQNNVSCWPHVTTSNTGIMNAMKVLNNLGYHGETNIYYMSRCYTTRHGAGPLPDEVEGKLYGKIEDLTNGTNEYQGALRFGLLNADMLTTAINHDLKQLSTQANVFVTLTCADQLDDLSLFVTKGQRRYVGAEKFLTEVSSVLDQRLSKLDGVFATNGMGRENIIQVDYQK